MLLGVRAVIAESFERIHRSNLVNMGVLPLQFQDGEGANALGIDGTETFTIDNVAGIKPRQDVDVIVTGKDGPAGRYLIDGGVQAEDFNSYGARRGNHEVMMRGTFANLRLRNQLAPGTEGGWTSYLPGGEVMSIYDAAMKYRDAGVPLVVIAGKEYGSGSSRDWAAKGTMLLGAKAVLAESFERIHRSNLVNMGVLPLEFAAGQSAASLGLTGREVFDFAGSGASLAPRSTIEVHARREDGSVTTFKARVRVDTPEELTAFRHGGILPYIARRLAK